MIVSAWGLGVVSLALVLAGPARATRDPTDYRDSLQQAAAAGAQDLNAMGRFDQAIDLCREQVRAFGPSVEVLYEWALAYNALGQLDDAVKRYDQVIDLDPSNAAARYDRAEILLGQGKIDAAATDLAVAAKERPNHWAVHFRLAQVAGLRHDPVTFETELMAALSNGLDLRALGGYPAWQAFMKDPQIGPVLERVMTVYGDDETVRQLKGL
ncbi:MAG: tetratricopeptide repeat protein [Oligoflexia bacterium]|nr:tetratricopeptide repeat protein [Oligoflexia bacterium]